jgi:hypothetical protein
MKYFLSLSLIFYSAVIMAKPSLEERQDKRFQITIGTGREYTEVSTIYSAGYYLTPDDLLLIRYTLSDSDKYGMASSKEMRTVTLGYRKFLGNSFNIMPTIYYRRFASDWSTGTTKAYFDYRDAGIGMRLGNEWQTDYFTYGVDWFGINKGIKVANKSQGLIVTSQKLLSFTYGSIYIGLAF